MLSKNALYMIHISLLGVALQRWNQIFTHNNSQSPTSFNLEGLCQGAKDILLVEFCSLMKIF